MKSLGTRALNLGWRRKLPRTLMSRRRWRNAHDLVLQGRLSPWSRRHLVLANRRPGSSEPGMLEEAERDHEMTATPRIR